LLKEVLTQQELKQYLAFEQSLKERFSPEEKQQFHADWEALVQEITANLHNAPSSAIGVQLGERCMTMVHGLYGKEYSHLRHKLWEEGYKKGKIGEHNYLTPAVVAWIDQACEAYWTQRVKGVLATIGVKTDATVILEWQQLFEEMYGDMREKKENILQLVLDSGEVTEPIKQWLKRFRSNILS
jgi:hypothetical protein